MSHLRIRGRRAVPLVGGHLERAGLHAVAAAHALVRVVDHRSERGLLQGPTGQTEAHAGCSQFMHSRRLKRSPWVSIAVSLCAEIFSSAAILSLYGRPHRSAQAPSQALQPMQRVLSYRIALGHIKILKFFL